MINKLRVYFEEEKKNHANRVELHRNVIERELSVRFVGNVVMAWVTFSGIRRGTGPREVVLCVTEYNWRDCAFLSSPHLVPSPCVLVASRPERSSVGGRSHKVTNRSHHFGSVDFDLLTKVMQIRARFSYPVLRFSVLGGGGFFRFFLVPGLTREFPAVRG